MKFCNLISVVGNHKTSTWYYSFFPEGYHNNGTLYFCEFCLNFYLDADCLVRHMKKCTLVCPPGDLIYKDDQRKNAVFEIDGKINRTYCENLSYLAKLFLDHKFMKYNTDPFLFYVLTEYDEFGYHIVGYFSKNKYFHEQNHNLNCILVLPFHQKKGYGKFIVNFSYELTAIENRIGTPETPLSDMGRQLYMAYWTQRLVKYFLELSEKQKADLTIAKMSKELFMKEKDIIGELFYFFKFRRT